MNLIKRHILSAALVLGLTVLPASAVRADEVAQRQQFMLQHLYEIYPQTSEPTIGLTIAWIHAALVINPSPEAVQRANQLLEDLLRNNLGCFDTHNKDIALAPTYWQLPLIAGMAIDPDLRGKLSDANRALISQMLWNFAENLEFAEMPRLDDVNRRKIYGSDNHNLHRRAIALLTAQLFKDDPDYADVTYADGSTPAERYDQWVASLLQYMQDRAGMGLSVEFASPTYQHAFLSPLFSIHQHAADARLREQTRKLIDLFFADMAQDSLRGIRGGGKVRAYKNRCNKAASDRSVVYTYLFAGEPSEAGQSMDLLIGGAHLAFVSDALTSDYRMLDVVADLFTHPQARGEYVYISNRIATGSAETLVMATGYRDFHYRPRMPSPLYRYSFVTPRYVLGWFTIDENETYLSMSTQNQCVGAITAAAPDSRVLVTLTPTVDHRTGYRELQSVGDRQTMLVRRQNDAKDAGRLRLYLSADFTWQADGGWIIAANGDQSVYCAVAGLLPDGMDTWQEEAPSIAFANGGMWFTFADPQTTILVELGQRADFDDIEAFKRSVQAGRRAWNSDTQTWTCQSANGGGALTLPMGHETPAIDGTPLNLLPAKVYDSPYLSADYGDSVVLIRDTQGREHRLDFNFPGATDASE